MRRTKRFIVSGVVGLIGVVLCLAYFDAPLSGPSRANFDRLQTGMTLAEVEAILGPAGPSISSIQSLDKPHVSYYIFKGRDGWSRVWAVHGRVTELEFDATLSIRE